VATICRHCGDKIDGMTAMRNGELCDPCEAEEQDTSVYGGAGEADIDTGDAQRDRGPADNGPLYDQGDSHVW
jgi:hypothetical protein